MSGIDFPYLCSMLPEFENLQRHITDRVSFSEEEVLFFLPYLKLLQIKKGEYFLQEGQRMQQVGFVVKGALQFFYLSEGKEINVHFFLEGDFAISYLDFRKGRPSKYYIRALEDCELVAFTAEALEEAYAKFKNWERFGRLIVEEAYELSMQRFESFLFLSAEERYLQMLEENPLFLQRIPLYHLASYLGIERESLSRIRKKLHQNARL